MADPIKFPCESCSATMKVPADAVGKKTKCPKCGFAQRVPEPSKLPAIVKPQLPAARKSSSAPTVTRDQVPQKKAAEILTIDDSLNGFDEDMLLVELTSEPLKPQVSSTAPSINIRVVDQHKHHEVEIVKPLAPPVISTIVLTTCPFCAEDIQAAAIKCKHCGEFLDGRPRTSAAAAPQVIVQAPPPPSIVVNTTNNVGNTTGGGQVQMVSQNVNGTAAILSFLFPGLGQIYKGMIALGILWIILVVGAYALAPPLGVLMHLCCIVHAAMYAK